MKDLQKLVGSLNKSGALSGFLGGVAGGGLTSLLSGKKSKKVGKKAVKYGALAAVGGLAWKAYQQYSEKVAKLSKPLIDKRLITQCKIVVANTALNRRIFKNKALMPLLKTKRVTVS